MLAVTPIAVRTDTVPACTRHCHAAWNRHCRTRFATIVDRSPNRVLMPRPRAIVFPMKRLRTSSMAFAVMAPAATCVVDCSGPPASVEPASTPCAQLGGVCQIGTCYNVGRTAYEYRGSIQGLCGSNPSSVCCVRPDVNGGLPAQLGSAGICGHIVCDSSSTCNRGIDAEGCSSGCYVAPVLIDAGCASCGSISCDVGCRCLDAARNHCEC